MLLFFLFLSQMKLLCSSLKGLISNSALEQYYLNENERKKEISINKKPKNTCSPYF